MESSDLTDPKSLRFFSQFEKHGFYGSDAVYLNAGGPGTELLRMLPPIIEAATKNCMQEELERDAQLFQYGVEEGHWQFRSFMATFLAEEYGDYVNSELLFLTGGASSGLWLILSRLFTPGSLVFVEDPTYFAALHIFRDLGMNVIPVKTDEDGLIIDELEKELKSRYPEKLPVTDTPTNALVYLVTVFDNPTGSTLPKDRCERLVNVAREYGVMVVCDDVYNLLHYDDSSMSPRRLFSFDNPSHPEYAGNVISNGSFSKILGPGLRIGWLEAPKWAIEKLKTL